MVDGLWRGEVEEGRGLTADSSEGGEPVCTQRDFCIYLYTRLCTI